MPRLAAALSKINFATICTKMGVIKQLFASKRIWRSALNVNKHQEKD